jgi:predicted RNA methylase
MRGKSVLDIGTKYGYFCLEALKRGANRVVGIDVNPEDIRKAKLLADCLGAKVEFLNLDIEKEKLQEKFDYVLCLNLLHHLKNPIGFLDKIIDLTKERLVLEVASLDRHHHKKLGMSLIQRYFLKDLPVILVDQNGMSGTGHSQKFFISIPAVENLLLHHRKMFERVESFTSEFGQGRFLSIGYKRQIKKLIVVAGPTSVGKSRLIQKLINHNLPEIAQPIGIEKGMEMAFAGANSLEQNYNGNVDIFLFHYDIVRPFRRSAKTHERDEALDILDTAEDIVALTLWTPPDILRKQFEQSKILNRGKIKKNERRWKIYQDYADKGKINEFYNGWLKFCCDNKVQNYMVKLQPEPEIISDEKWMDLAAK